MIKVTNLSFSFPDKDLYNDISFTIEAGQSCAFIGRSGSGKSTLVSMLLDPEKLVFDGKIEIDEGCSMGFVSQFNDVDPSETCTVFEYIAQDFITLQDRIAKLCEEMGESENLEELLEEYQSALDLFEAMDGENYESNIQKKLSLADLIQHRDLDVTKLSGGEFKLVQVIKQMLTTPQFLIMDEPDSFLDFENLNGLKNLINAHKGTMLTITHSRYLLNHCFNKILHLENELLQEFDGRYIDYHFALLAGKVDIQEQACRDSEEIARNAALVEERRFIATNSDSAANGRALKSRVSYQERLEARRVMPPFLSIEKPSISFVAQDVPQDEVMLSVEDFSLSYEELLLENVTFEIGSHDKVAIIGANGAGKTSLLRAILRNDSDAITISEKANVACLSQHQDDRLDEGQTIYDEFFDAGFQTYDEISDYLATFGFPVEKMKRKISTLSGGEKNILGLAKVCKEPSNLLILDEPTSHLDTYAQIALEEAIAAYEGAIVMISHDFYSIVNAMDYVLMIENKTVRKIKMKKFKRMIYAKHFDKDYLEHELTKKQLETRIELALSREDFNQAKSLLPELDEVIQLL